MLALGANDQFLMYQYCDTKWAELPIATMVKDLKIDSFLDNFLLTVVFDMEISCMTIPLSPLDTQLLTAHALAMHHDAHVRIFCLFLQKLVHF